MNRPGRAPRAFPAALAMFVLALCALCSAFLPLAMPLGVAAGGVLETGQVEPGRWWTGGVAALLVFLLLSWRWGARARLYWLAVLAGALVTGVAMLAAGGAGKVGSAPEPLAPRPAPRIGVVSALPLFWADGAGPADLLAEGAPAPVPVMRHAARPIDHIDAAALRGVDALLLAQPRLLQPRELVLLDQWIRRGGRMVVLADPLLVWPSDLPPADPRRPPLTSLLDPLLGHWGLRLEPADPSRGGVDRRMLGTGHVVMLAGASRFSLTGGGEGASCTLTEEGLMALCRIGLGAARLVADADLIDERLWLADRRWSDRREAWSADIPDLIDAWLAAPLRDTAPPAPRRVRDEAALFAGMRHALLALLVWAGLGWAGQKWILYRAGEGKQEGMRDKAGTVVAAPEAGPKEKP